MLLGVALAGASAASGASDADLARGVSWLKAQVQPQGQLAVQSQVATLQQARCETASTLLRLSGPDAQVAALVASLQEASADAVTESLACWQQLRRQLGETILASEVETRRVGELGYAPHEGGRVAGALDTGWALAAQRQTLTSSSKSQLLAWLQANQQADGSFAAIGTSDLLSTAVILRGLRSEASTDATAAAVATKAATYLLGKVNAQGNWLGDVGTTALVFEAVHPYTGQTPGLAGAVEAYLLGQQQADGSWRADPYLTAVALRALALTSAPAQHPNRASLKVRFVDARNSQAVPGVVLQSATPTISVVSDAAGMIHLANVEAASYQFVASMTGYATVTLGVTLSAGQILDLGNVQLVTAPNATVAVVSGTVRDRATNTAIEGAIVSIDGQGRSAVAAADGSYLISDVSPGSITISASKPGYLAAAGTLQAQAGQVVNFSPWLGRDPGDLGAADCKLLGTIVAAGTQAPIQGVSIIVSGSNNLSAITDAGGRYQTSNLTSGLVTVSASKAGYDSASATTDLVCSTLRPTAIDFSPRLYAAGQSPTIANLSGVTGTVTDAGTNRPIAGAQLLLTPSTGAAKTGISGADGRFAFAGLDGASAQLQVQAADYEGTTRTYVLTPLQELDVGQVRLRKPKVQQLLPDLKVMAVLRDTARTDAQNLTLTGAVQVQIANAGTESSPAHVSLTAFSDLDRNGRYDPAVDTVLGTGSISHSLPPGATTSIAITVAGVMPFRDAAVSVVIDKESSLAELTKDNNVRSTADQALLQPPSKPFGMALKWEWAGGGVLPTSRNVMMNPIAIPTRDTNGDGKINSDDVSDVIVTSYSGYHANAGHGVIRVLDGRTGAEIKTLTSPNTTVFPVAGLAAADLDGDGVPEIVGISDVSAKPIAVRPDGSLLWAATEGTLINMSGEGNWSMPLIADLDADGTPEVIITDHVYDGKTGRLKWVARRGDAPEYYYGSSGNHKVNSVAVVADLFATGQQNLILGASVFDSTGALVWTNKDVGDGSVALADFDNDGFAEIVVVAAGRIHLLDRFGTPRWSYQTSNVFNGGPPTIADFDGDGVPDIGVGIRTVYEVVRADGTPMWPEAQAIEDKGSAMTGSTAFDFHGDGKVKIVYADEVHLRVFDGATGSVLSKTLNASATTLEYPIVVDVDRDGHAEIVTTRNTYPIGSSSTGGVRVFQATDNSWVRARGIWNQHVYTINNINDDLTVPRTPEPSWKAHNTFRLNKRTDGDPRAIPDLTVGFLRVADGGALGSTLTVRVGNAGSYKIDAGAKLAVYSADPALGQPGASAVIATATLAAGLMPGQWVDASFAIRDLASLNALGRVWIVGDDDGTGKTALTDFDRSNNTLAGDLPAVGAALMPSLATDKSVYTEADQAVFTALASNAGSFAQSVQVRFTVLDAAGRTVDVLPLGATTSVPATGSASVAGLWPVAGVLSGGYQVKAEFLSPAGLIYGAATANFSVAASQSQATSARIGTDRISYSSAQTVQLTARTANNSANTLMEDVQARTTVTGASGQQVFNQIEAIAQLAPGGQRQYNYGISASGLAVGNYSASLQLLDAQGVVLAQSTASFDVLSAQQSGVGLTGQLQAMPSVVLIGQPVALNLAATNNGNAALADVPVTVRIVEPVSGALVTSFTATVANWAQGASQALAWSWTAHGLDGQTLVAVASASIAGRDVPLGQTNIRLVGVPLLNAQPAQLDFAPVYLGEIAAARTTTIASTGTVGVTAMTLSLTGSNSSQFVIPEGGCAQTASLPIGATCTLTISHRPQVAGSHSAQARISYASGADLVVQLTGEAKPVIFTGTVGTDGPEVEAGQSVGLNYSVSNPASITSTMAGFLSVQDPAGQILGHWPLDRAVGALASHAGNQAYATGAQAQTLTVVLSQNLSSDTRVLATSTFTVIDPPVPLGLATSLKGNARILVLVSCPPGLGSKEDVACVAQRSQALESYLGALGHTAKTVSTREAFLGEMRCGTYNTYWISGGAAKLDAQDVGELREAVYRGEALWMDGVHDSRNQLLHPVAGVNDLGKLPTTNQSASLVEGGLYASQSLATSGQPTKFELTTGEAQGLFTQIPGQQLPIPAVVSNDYGQGKSLLFAFDLAAMVNADASFANSQLAGFVTASASYAATATPTLTLGDVTQLTASVANLGTRTVAFRAEATLPAGLASITTHPSAQLTANIDGSTQAVWAFSLPGGATQEIAWRVRAAQAGSYTLPLAIYSLPAVGSSLAPKLRASSEITLEVKEAQTLLHQALASVAALQPSSNADKSNKTKALNAVDLALALHAQVSYEQAIAQWVAAADALMTITTADITAARAAVALAIEASADALCIQRCGSAPCQ